MSLFLLVLCVVVIAIHTAYYFFIFPFFIFSKKQSVPNNQPVSVILCAKNEAENLKKLLPKLVQQKYPDYELVLIDDRSYDDTQEIYQEFAEKYAFIKVVTVKEVDHFYGNKKYALTLGIKAAKNDCLLFTDADCLPKTNYWIQEMANQYHAQKKVVLGYGPYQSNSSFLNKIIRYETVITAIQYFSYAKIGIPYMGVGRNLMYSKKLFLKNKGYNQYIKVMSGDDDLLINQIATKENTAISFHPKTFMVSAPKTTWKSYLIQKKRHLSTAKFYQKKHQILLGMYALNRLLFWCIFPLALTCINKTFYLILIGALVAFKWISEYIVVGISLHKLREKKLLVLVPFLDACLLLVQIYLFISNTFCKPKKWS